jgi:hypothetical protein
MTFALVSAEEAVDPKALMYQALCLSRSRADRLYVERSLWDDLDLLMLSQYHYRQEA